jgi:hypothetical protein
MIDKNRFQDYTLENISLLSDLELKEVRQHLDETSVRTEQAFAWSQVRHVVALWSKTVHPLDRENFAQIILYARDAYVHEAIRTTHRKDFDSFIYHTEELHPEFSTRETYEHALGAFMFAQDLV